MPLSDNTLKMQQPRSTSEPAMRGLNAVIGARDARSHVRGQLVALIAETMADRGLSQVQAAKLCRTDQPTLSKVLRGRTDRVSLDKLVGWLLALGRPVEVHIGRIGSGAPATLKVVADGRRAVD